MEEITVYKYQLELIEKISETISPEYKEIRGK